MKEIVGDFTSTTLLAVEDTGGTFEERARHLQHQLWQDLEHSQMSGVRVLRELARLHILDHQGAPAPVGVPGELYIGGKGAARGYQGRPELTAERFVPDPFTEEKGERLYRTGDLVRYRVGGALEYLGRMDTQVKVRGYRIELSEIEAVLSQHPQVYTCVVALREDGEGDKQLIGCLVAHKDEKSIPVNDVRAYLRKRLPEYMLPGHWVVLDALPLTPNGKVDRRALLALYRGQKEDTRTYTASRTPLEAQLAHIWAEVLRVEQATIGILDNFFERGSHSLKATQVIARMKQTLGVDLQLDHLFEHPTIEEMAQCIQNIQGLRKQP